MHVSGELKTKNLNEKEQDYKKLKNIPVKNSK